ncbi:hypothetical protein ACFV2N_17890 [Streptomyces sp. NPDC059680]|uniref:hypothetical protein n=1 Tax=Streptomyces sp. NPDC059680 TaxID=3346904 RepID=UPI0036AB5AA8
MNAQRGVCVDALVSDHLLVGVHRSWCCRCWLPARRPTPFGSADGLPEAFYLV